MTSPGGDIVVRHNEAESRFEAIVDGYLSVADYGRQEGALVMSHTFVPPELRGRGVAEKLVRAALAYASREGLRVVPACSYVDAFIRRNPEYQSLLG